MLPNPSPTLDWTTLASPALQGLLLCGSLIVAIGAQNAFLLRQGLRREHVGPLVLACSLADALLIALGVAGLARLLGEQPQLAQWLAGAGVLFLIGYGLRALWQARRPASLQAAQGQHLSRGAALWQLAGFTLLNPHVYLDTVLLMGSVGAQQTSAAARLAFVAGASSASVIWFTSLGYGARRLAPLFARPRAWQVFDALIGAAMLLLAWQLLPLATGGHPAP